MTFVTQRDLFSVNSRHQLIEGTKVNINSFDVSYMVHLYSIIRVTVGTWLSKGISSSYSAFHNRIRVLKSRGT